MRNEGLQKTLIAGAAIEANRIVKFSGADTVVKASAATDLLIGVSDNLGATAQGDRLDVILDGIALVKYGGTVNAGDPLTADANGMAVAAAPAATISNRIIGIAMEGGSANDIGSVLLRQGSVTNGANA